MSSVTTAQQIKEILICSILIAKLCKETVARELFLTRGGNRQIDGFFIEFGPRFCPRNKRSLKIGLRQIWTAFLSQK